MYSSSAKYRLVVAVLLSFFAQSLLALAAPCAMAMDSTAMDSMSPASMAAMTMSEMDHGAMDYSQMQQTSSADCCDVENSCSMSGCAAATLPAVDDSVVISPSSVPRLLAVHSSPLAANSGSLYRPPIL